MTFEFDKDTVRHIVDCAERSLVTLMEQRLLLDTRIEEGQALLTELKKQFGLKDST